MQILDTKGKFSWILADARERYAAGMHWQAFAARYLGQNSPFLALDAQEALEYILSPEYSEIKALMRRLAIRQNFANAPAAPAQTAGRAGRTVAAPPQELEKPS